MFEILFQQILDLCFINNPWSDRFFYLLFFLDEDFGSVNFLLLEFAGFDTFVDFGLVLLLFLKVLLDVNEGVISLFLLVLDFGDLFDLDLIKIYLKFGLLFFGLFLALFEVFEFHLGFDLVEGITLGVQQKIVFMKLISLIYF